MRRVAIIGIFFCAAALAVAQQPADFSGRWKLDRDLTTADMRWNRTTAVEIIQSEDDIRFDYFDDRHRFASDTFITDWKERPRWVTRIERAYARVKWQGGALMIHTRSFLDAQGYQSYNLDDRWELSDKGQTLTDYCSDGKVMVFYRVSQKKPSDHPVIPDR